MTLDQATLQALWLRIGKTPVTLRTVMLMNPAQQQELIRLLDWGHYRIVAVR